MGNLIAHQRHVQKASQFRRKSATSGRHLHPTDAMAFPRAPEHPDGRESRNQRGSKCITESGKTGESTIGRRHSHIPSAPGTPHPGSEFVSSQLEPKQTTSKERFSKNSSEYFSCALLNFVQHTDHFSVV